MGKLSKSIMLGMLSTGLLLSSVVVVDTESTVQAASTINNSKEVSQKAYVSSAKKKLSVYKKRLDENIPKFNEYTAIRKNLPALGNLEDEDYYFEVRHYYIVPDYMSYERSKYISKIRDTNKINLLDDYSPKYPSRKILDEFEKVELELKKKKIDRKKVDSLLDNIKSSLPSSSTFMDFPYNLVLKVNFDRKELRFLHSEMYGGNDERSNVVKKFTPIELNYIKLMETKRVELSSLNTRYLETRNSIENRTDELENYTKLNKYGEYLKNLVYDTSAYSKLAVKQRENVMAALDCYRNTRAELMNNGIYSEDDISKRKEDMLKRTEEYYEVYSKASEEVKNTNGKKSGKIDIYNKAATDMVFNIQLANDIYDHWNEVTSTQPIQTMSSLLKKAGMDMEE
ncbi:hypothetical protein MKZ08_12920 [Viridibacillus sp. FSL R5-0477]|uniref:Uncharacterized protein n=1 Tax=Viridibacillus arenosi FSL R5-213 TaxID=1227360 RepID=W4EKS8_9BACL|nr:hypothetical protein [Viridibacillus arenosi]ETT80597.1 hypothetical protein C176_21506 [Viridibacillus arenosi FSL R5-213]OMC87096.1 hypothetical protein BK137_21055 [Viridibacillus arenosi]